MSSITLLTDHGTLIPMPPRLIPHEALASNLRHLMSLENLSTHDVARRSKVSQRTVVHILHGTASPTLDTVDKLANAFGLNLWHLIMPGLPLDLRNGSAIARLYDAYRSADKEGRELIIKLAEHEAEHNKK